ncbi:cytidylyltransferase domain-containing protein [Reichenbachiella sp.]|uniref:acylneuraminate cytidylyltransferase family protein n=1 Tax=Reichenbachiella sp. TaxID=2184521 RepID=UPI003BB1FE16
MDKHYGLVALLPMKLHSERVPGKNFKEFSGQPLFTWILNSLLSVEKIEKVVINTDAVDVLEKYDIIQNEKIILRNRPEEIRGDLVSMNKVIHDDISHIESDHYLMTHTTNPLISHDTINNAISEYFKSIESGFDSLFTVNQFQSRFYYKDVSPINHNPAELIRTQDLEPIYEENSCLYLFSGKSFDCTNARIGEKPSIYSTPKYESIDIDDYESWKLADLIKKSINK